ncbi:MAG: DUF1947 domain-containing protein [Candidatus Bathyarchaeia archaeon]
MREKIRRYFLKAKEAKSLLESASKKLKVNFEEIFGGKVNVEIAAAGSNEIFMVNGNPVLARTGGEVFPTLNFREFIASAPRVVVDMGAVSHVCNGANVMAPGVVRIDGIFEKGDFVLIVDEKYGKPIAVGVTDYGVEEARSIKRGVIVRNIHFVGDELWNLMKKLRLDLTT